MFFAYLERGLPEFVRVSRTQKVIKPERLLGAAMGFDNLIPVLGTQGENGSEDVRTERLEI